MIILMDNSSPGIKIPPTQYKEVQDPCRERINSARQLIQIIHIACNDGDVDRANPLLERQQSANSLKQ